MLDVQKTTVVTKVGRPPVLGVGHQGVDVLLQCIIVELLELLSIVEVRTERVLSGVVLTEDVDPELVWPPVRVPGASAGNVGRLLHGTLALRHDESFGSVLWKRMFEENKLQSSLSGQLLGI